MGFWSIVPPALAIGLSMLTRQVHLSLFAGLWLGASLLAGGHPLRGLADALERCVAVFADAGNTRVVLFTALVGAVITLGRRAGGVDGFVRWVHRLLEKAPDIKPSIPTLVAGGEAPLTGQDWAFCSPSAGPV